MPVRHALGAFVLLATGAAAIAACSSFTGAVDPPGASDTGPPGDAGSEDAPEPTPDRRLPAEVDSGLLVTQAR